MQKHKYETSVLGILHPTKGFIGLDADKVTYPNESEPGKIDEKNTLRRDHDAECEGYLQTVIDGHDELKKEKCTVHIITVAYKW